jgi:hypothetical protein
MLPAHHPDKVLANCLLRHWTEFPHSLRSYLELPLNFKESYPVQLTTIHEEKFEDVISHFNRHVEHQTMKRKDPVSIHPLQYHGEEIGTLTLTHPSLRALIRGGRMQYFELDVNFHTFRPSRSVIPIAVTVNYAIPLGLIITPTERQESDKVFYAGIFKYGEVDQAIADAIPLLTDECKTTGVHIG